MFGSIALELVVGYILLLSLTKFLGKTQLNQITAFDFIAVVVLGELIGNGLYDENIHVGHLVYATVIWGALSFISEWATQKWKKTRSFLEGNPSIVVRNGEVQQDEMTKNRLDINQLRQLLRAKDIFTLRDVAYAILEADGSITVMKEPPNSNMPSPVLPVTLVTDGELITDNLKEAGISEDTLIGALKQHGVEDYKDVLFAEWKADASPPLHLNLKQP
ncbi:DUF421 domain-containing protein [Bacillaceae bacterium SIJ1]|uniref:YetF domain-containing protein n=1 Tax=Litoribacterium kuwaitense TaxID=1398745 RepID=UPI0013EA803B|nr:DUF421 domain-containing protein [Litoribacterium kuwaitense]NGP46731.1 DUF421 domain-containing protein [Litoribacterium kuwaitense]